jgi:hypothetical protein
VEITILAPSPAPLLAADQEPEAGSLWVFAIRFWDSSIAISVLFTSICVRLLWRSFAFYVSTLIENGDDLPMNL